MRYAAGLIIGFLALVTTGCVSPDPLDDSEHLADASPRQVAQEFFDLLAEGDAEGAGELMLDPTFVTPGGLDNDFYSDAIRPKNARVVSVGEDDGDTVVTVEYTLKGQGDPRSIDVEISSDEDQPKIDTWSHRVVTIYTDPSTIRVNGSTGVDLSEYGALILLPGIYDIQYVDEMGISGIGPDAVDSAPFPFEFPVTADEADLADGVRYDRNAISFESRIRDGVDEAVAVAMAPGLQQLLESCTAERLVGPSCPADLVETVELDASDGEIDTTSIAWTDLGIYITSHDQRWVALQLYNVDYVRSGVTERSLVDVGGTLSKDASGQFVVTIDPTLDLR